MRRVIGIQLIGLIWATISILYNEYLHQKNLNAKYEIQEQPVSVIDTSSFKQLHTTYQPVLFVNSY